MTCLGRRVAMLAASVVSIRKESMPGCSAAICSSSSVRRPPMMTVFPRACSSRARARPMPLVEPGMKTVFRVIFMVRVSARVRGGHQRAVIGDRRSLVGVTQADTGGMDRACARRLPAARHATRCSPSDVGLTRGRRRRALGLRREEVAQLAGDVDRLLHPPGAAARPAAERADARLPRPGAAADRRRARLPVPGGGAQRTGPRHR